MSVIEEYVDAEACSTTHESSSISSDDVEENRESLAILASLGTTKEYIGVGMSLGKKTTSERC